MHRVLKPGGAVALVDNVVPAGSVGDYINAFSASATPATCAPGPWRNGATLKAQKLAVTHEEQIGKTMEFNGWAARHDATMQALLRSMLTQTTPAVNAVLEPKEAGGDITFRLCEGLFIAKRA